MKCPCCDAETKKSTLIYHNVVFTSQGKVTLTPRETEVLTLLLKYSGILVRYSTLSDELGGVALKRVAEWVYRLRVKVTPIGLAIYNTQSQGYRLVEVHAKTSSRSSQCPENVHS